MHKLELKLVVATRKVANSSYTGLTHKLNAASVIFKMGSFLEYILVRAQYHTLPLSREWWGVRKNIFLYFSTVWKIMYLASSSVYVVILFAEKIEIKYSFSCQHIMKLILSTKYLTCGNKCWDWALLSFYCSKLSSYYFTMAISWFSNI